ITVIDARARNVAANILVDGRPRGVVFTPDGKRAYVTCEVAGTVDVIDVAARRVIHRIKLRPVDHPVGLIVTRDGRTVYAATGRGDAVVSIDTVADRVTR